MRRNLKNIPEIDNRKKLVETFANTFVFFGTAEEKSQHRNLEKLRKIQVQATLSQ